jgi:hypothetical protein
MAPSIVEDVVVEDVAGGMPLPGPDVFQVQT